MPESFSPTADFIKSQSVHYVNSSMPLADENTSKKLQSSFARFADTYKKNLATSIQNSLSRNRIPSLKELNETKNAAYHRSLTQIDNHLSQDNIPGQFRTHFRNFTDRASIALGFKGIDSNDSKTLEQLGLGLTQPNFSTFTRGASPESFGLALAISGNATAQQEAYLSLLAKNPQRLDKALRETSARLTLLRQNKSPDPRERKEYIRLKTRYAVLVSADAFSRSNPQKQQAVEDAFQGMEPGYRAKFASEQAWQVTDALTGSLPAINSPTLPRKARTIFMARRFVGSLASVKNNFSLGSAGSTTLVSRGGTGTLAATSKLGRIAGIFRAGSTAAKVGGGPVGLILLAIQLAPLFNKVKNFLRKVALGVGALIAYLLFKFLLKILGAVAGFIFGAVTGLPLLFLGPPGWIAYAGWIGFWTYRGWTHPLEMIHLATHPWEIITKPLELTGNFLKTIYAPQVSFYTGIPGAIASAFSAVGSFLTGLAATIWGGFVSAGGAILGGLASFGSTILGSLGSLSIPASAVAMPVFGSVGGIATLGIIGTITTGAIFFNADTDPRPFDTSGNADNPYFTLTKEANPDSMPDPNQTITFKITLEVKETDLEAITMSDNITAIGQNGSQDHSLTTDNSNPPKPISPPCQGEDIDNGRLSAGSQWICEFTVAPKNTWDDTLVINKVEVTARPAGGAAVTGSTSAATAIGTPPANCPLGWPTDAGYITQGPEGGTSHGPNNWEAIDIGQPGGTLVYATLNGTAQYREDRPDNYVIQIVPHNCPGLPVVEYVHLAERFVHPGEEVTFGQELGTISYSQAHLHYQFDYSGRNFPLIYPYVPLPSDFNRACDNSYTPCNVSW